MYSGTRSESIPLLSTGKLGTPHVTSGRYQIPFAKEELCNVHYGHTTCNSKETSLLNTRAHRVRGNFSFFF